MEPKHNPINASLAFFEKLPPTIKKDVTALVLLYAFWDNNINTSTDIEERLRNNPNQPSAQRTISTILSTIAAADYVPDNFTLNEANNRRLISRFAQKLPQLLLGHQLRQKHFERALQEFDLLKQGALSFHMLQDFENILQSQRNSI